MRVAVSGAHGTGKTTLVHVVADSLPGYTWFEEPYHELETEGYVFSDPPSLEDFERQLLHSTDALLASPEDCLFDRCPLDLLAYIVTHEDAAKFDTEGWLPRVQEAMGLLDLVVFVPIEDPERIPGAELPGLRRRIDGELREAVLSDSWGFGFEGVEVMGAPGDRAEAVLAALEGMRE